jgi:hypothetical protein
MGGKVETAANPGFKVRVAGSFKQFPGCPDYVKGALEAKRLLKMSLGECYNPSDERYAIERIEVVRVRPQNYEGEPVENLIEDPWLVHPCNQAEEVCEFNFSDPGFAAGNRDALYYVRAVEEPIDMINAANLRTTIDEEGNAVATMPVMNAWPKRDTGPGRHRFLWVISSCRDLRKPERCDSKSNHDNQCIGCLVTRKRSFDFPT